MQLEALIKLANEDNDAAYKYYEENKSDVLNLFKSSEDLLKYFNETEANTTLTFKMICHNEKYFANLIKSPEEAFSLLKANNVYATLLFMKGAGILRQIFINIDHIIKLAILDSQCATFMLATYNDYPELKQYRSQLFKDAKINDLLIQLSANEKEGEFALTILKLIPEENIESEQLSKLIETMKSNPSINNIDINGATTNTLEDYIELTKKDCMEASDLLSKNPKKVLGFFETVEDFISFNKLTGETYTSFRLVIDHQEYISSLFRTHEDFLTFVNISKRAADMLLHNANYQIRSLFKTADHLIQLAFLSNKCADEILLCGKDIKSINQYHKEVFKDARISDLLLELAGKVPNGRFALNIVRCIPNRNIEFERFNRLLDILKNNSSVEDKEVDQLRQSYNKRNTGFPRFFLDVGEAVDNFAQEAGNVIFGYK